MKIAEQHKGCRYWGYEPASAEFKDAISLMGMTKVREIRKQYETERRAIKMSGFKRTAEYGFSFDEAKQRAKEIEKATGIEMRVFSHDYL